MADEFVNWLFVFARLGALLGMLPLFSMQNFPGRLRVALSGMIALVLAPFLPALAVHHLSMGALIGGFASELSIGLLLGFICRLVFAGIEAAGNVVATEMGLTMSAEFNQLSSTQSTAPGMMLNWMALMLWLSLDLHHWMIAALQRSYTLIPFGGAHLSEALLQDVVHRSGSLFVIAIEIAAPAMVVSFVLTLVFSLLGRAVPQMNVFAESFPVRTLVGLLIFGSTCLFMAQHIVNYLRHLPEDALQVARLMGSG